MSELNRNKFSVRGGVAREGVVFNITAALTEVNLVCDVRAVIDAVRLVDDAPSVLRDALKEAKRGLEYKVFSGSPLYFCRPHVVREALHAVYDVRDGARVMGEDADADLKVWVGVVLMALFNARFGKPDGRPCDIERLHGELAEIVQCVFDALDYHGLCWTARHEPDPKTQIH